MRKHIMYHRLSSRNPARVPRALPFTFLVLTLAALMVAGCGDDTDPPDEDQMDLITDLPDDDGNDVTDVETDDNGDVETETDTDDVPDSDGDMEEMDGDDMPDVVTCEPECGTNQTCNSMGECKCDMGFDDCNSDPQDGCEQSILEPDNCGACGAVGQGCDAFGVNAMCQADNPPQVGFCPVVCDTGYYDIDGVDETGCETGLLGTISADVSADLPGTVQDVALDGDNAFVLVLDGTLKIVPIDVSGMMPVVGTIMDTGSTAGGRARVSATGGQVFVAVQGAVIAYSHSAGTLTEVETDLFAGVVDTSAVVTPVTANALAEFVAVGSGGTRWYAIYNDGDQPGGLPGGACDGTGVLLCQLNSNVNPSNATGVVAAEFRGSQYAVAVGDTTVEFHLESGPTITPLLVNGDNISTTFDDLVAGSETLYALNDTAIDAFDYAFDGSNNPSSRASSPLFTGGGAPSGLALLDDGRLAVGQDADLAIVMTADGTSDIVPAITGTVALDSDGSRLVTISSSRQLDVFDLELGPLQ